MSENRSDYWYTPGIAHYGEPDMGHWTDENIDPSAPCIWDPETERMLDITLGRKFPACDYVGPCHCSKPEEDDPSLNFLIQR